MADRITSPLLTELIKLTKISHDFYSSEIDLPFQMAIDRKKVEKLTDPVNERLKSLFIKTINIQSQYFASGLEKNVDQKIFLNEDNLVNNISAVMDGICERVDQILDQFKKQNVHTFDITKQSDVVQQESFIKGGKKVVVFHAQNIARPQLNFKDKVDNSNSSKFVPKIRMKPNALTKLPLYEEEGDKIQQHLKALGVGEEYSHPYKTEIEQLSFPLSLIEKSEPTFPTPLNETPLERICTEPDLDRLVSELKGESIIAIDLEHHNYRSFQGFVCLMQISSRSKDYLVDTLILRHCMFKLNEVFTDGNTVKVLHGADSDVIWLQRDFGLYLVNLFDTYFASKYLNHSSHSLAFLLKEYVNVEVDKSYQLADWRVRPLPFAMENYAREDTHYLIYIFEVLRNLLLESGMLMEVIQKSTALSLKTYEKEVYSNDSWMNLYRKYDRNLDEKRLNVFKAIHRWRDQVARDQDESVRYVLANHMLFRLSEVCPTDAAGVIGCCHPVPPLVRVNASDLALLISKTISDFEKQKEGILKPAKPMYQSIIQDLKAEIKEPIIAKGTFNRQKKLISSKKFVGKALFSALKSSCNEKVNEIVSELPNSFHSLYLIGGSNTLEKMNANEKMEEEEEIMKNNEESVDVAKEPVNEKLSSNDVEYVVSSFLSKALEKTKEENQQEHEEPAVLPSGFLEPVKIVSDIFDPFSSIKEPKFKKQKRIHIKPRSGNKSRTFKK